MIDLNEKVIFITGGSRGIGRAIVHKLLNNNGRVIAGFNSNNTFDHSASDNFLKTKIDVKNNEEVRNALKKSVEAFGKVDVLINNAGICKDNLLTFMKLEEWNEVINVNLTGIFNCTKTFSKHMIRNRSGKIINIGSLRGFIGNVGQCNYTSSKAALIGFTKSIAKELGPYNIKVNLVCPGFILTDLNKEKDKEIETSKKMSLLGRIENNLNDMVNFILFMCSDLVQDVSGQVFHVDSRVI